MDWIDYVLILARALLAFLLWLISTALLIWGERRIVAKMQTRIGPNRLGPFGVFQVLADGAKMFFKEDITPRGVDKVVYFAAPLVSATVAFLTFAVIPFGGTMQLELGGRLREIPLQVWDPEIGLLWFLAMSSIGVYGVALGGWASGSKYPLLGGVRSSAQLISYELSMGLSMGAVFIWAGTLRSSEIVANQTGTFFGFVPAWHILPMIPAFFIFFISVVAEAQRPPFDLAEAEGELVAGFHTEYSGAKFAMFMLAEFMAVITMSAMTVTLFLGGPSGPLFGLSPTGIPAALLGVVYFLAKCFIFVFVFIWLRGSLPRLRYDRLMDLGWKVMLPLSLVWVLLTGGVVTLQQQGYTRTFLTVLAIVVVTFIALSSIAPLLRRSPAPAPGADGGGGGSRPLDGDGDGDGGLAITPRSETTTVPAGDPPQPGREPEKVGATRAAADPDS